MDKMKRFQEFKDKTTINVNGEITPAEDAKISVFDRGFLYGDSIYEVTYSDHGQLIFFNEHLDRLYNSANLLNMTIFLEREEIIKEALKTLKQSKLERAYVRIIITRGETEINLDPSTSFKNNLIIIVKPQPPYPQDNYTKGLKLMISSVLRNDRKSINPNAKSGNYLNNVMAISEAKKLGFDDAIMVNHQDKITEGTTFNIWMVKDGIIKTPPETSGLLKGITRQKVIKICREQNFNLEVSDFSSQMLLEADEVFMTSSTKGIMPIYQVNDKIFNNEKIITNKLSALYDELIQEQIRNKEFSYL